MNPPIHLATPPPDLPPTVEAPGAIRPFRREDIPGVVALRQAAFRLSAQGSTAELTAYVTRVFFDHPWKEIPLHSLVQVDASGEVNGFVGVAPRRIKFRGRTLTMAVMSQLMVRPGSPPGSGLPLVRSLFEGPQDLTFSDAANDAARKTWTRVGGRTATIPSLFWTLPLRPTRFALGRWGRSLPARMGHLLARPVTDYRDRRPPVIPGTRGGPVVTEPLALADHLPVMEELIADWPLVPVYDLAGFAWLVREASVHAERGPLIGRFVRDQTGAPVGWYLFHANRGGVGEVVQLGARPGEQARVLAPLVAEAHRFGVVALRGRLEGGLIDVFGGTAVLYTREGPWALAHSRDPELMAVITEAAGFLTRLDAEWSLNF